MQFKNQKSILKIIEPVSHHYSFNIGSSEFRLCAVQES